jgi:hypothetical protein
LVEAINAISSMVKNVSRQKCNTKRIQSMETH